jgi:hypothetical protein
MLHQVPSVAVAVCVVCVYVCVCVCEPSTGVIYVCVCLNPAPVSTPAAAHALPWSQRVFVGEGGGGAPVSILEEQ